MGGKATLENRFQKSECVVGQRKVETERFVQKIFKTTSKTNFEKQRQLGKELHNLLTQLKSSNTLQQIGKIQQELGTIHNKFVIGAKICSKKKFYHENEKPTKYFFNL